ncbi:MAG: HAMP domain-containing histidine kinase [Flavobacteriia bacterium]|nr:HAMP domain-containing histidine kinase [Flavobacteriia bacterium]
MATKSGSNQLIPNWLRKLLVPWKITLISILASEILYAFFYITTLYQYPTGWYGFVISFVIPVLVALPTSSFVIRLLNYADNARERLEVETELRSRLLAILSHDVRSPLAALNSMLELLGDDLTEDEVYNLLGELKSQLHFTKDILDRITLWARMRMQGTHELTTVELDEVLHEVKVYTERFARPYDVNVKADWPSGLHVQSDKDVLVIALTNLANNAVKYSPANGTVTLSAETIGNKVILKVSDEGRGLPTEDLNELLSPKISDDYAINTDSMGVGLFLAREFVELTGGKLTARNLPGKGAQFSITLGAQI